MSDPVSYPAVLFVAEPTVLVVSGLLAAERRRRSTRSGRRALGCYRQAVLVWRWFVDGTQLAQLAVRAAGHAPLHVAGTLLRTDRCLVPGPTAWTDRPERRVELWWSGQHAAHAHGGTIEVVTASDSWPLCTSPLCTSKVRPGRAHDTAALPAHAGVLPRLAA